MIQAKISPFADKKISEIEKEKLLKTKLLKIFISEQFKDLVFTTKEVAEEEIKELLTKYFSFPIETKVQITESTGTNISFIHFIDESTKVIVDCTIISPAKL